MQQLDAALPGNPTAMFLQGCSGDINPGKYADSTYNLPQAVKFAHRLSDAVLTHIQKDFFTWAAGLKTGYRTVLLPVKETDISEAEVRAQLLKTIQAIDDFENYFSRRGKYGTFARAFLTLEPYQLSQDDIIQTYVQCVTIGETALVFYPGEMLVEHGLHTKAESPFKHTAATAYTDRILYVPTRAAYKEGGYEVRTTTTAEGSGEQLTAAALEMLQELSGE
jgi:hypothetical protein